MRLAFVLLIMSGSLYAQAPELAVCKEGQCVMPETVYGRLKDDLFKLFAAEAKSEHAFEREQHRADSCEAFLKGNKT